MRGAWDMRRCLYRIITMGFLLCFIFANVTSVHAIAPVPMVELATYEITTTNPNNVYVQGTCSICVGQNIALFDSTGKIPYNYTVAENTNSKGSFKIQVPSNFLKEGINTFKIISLPVRNTLNSSNPKTITIIVSTQPQPQPQPVVKNPLFGVKLTKVTKGKKSFTAKWKKASKKQQKQFSGYQIQYSTSTNFTTGVKTKSTTKKKASKVVIRKLKAKTNYYVRIRRFKKAGSSVIYSDWSVVKRVRTK